MHRRFGPSDGREMYPGDEAKRTGSITLKPSGIAGSQDRSWSKRSGYIEKKNRKNGSTKKKEWTREREN